MTVTMLSPSPPTIFGQYLHEISVVPLLSVEEERELARRIRLGDDEALERLVRSNLRFVVSIAKRYRNRGLALDDLVAEGNCGLLYAARKFDETKGVRFITYAVWWVRQAMLHAIADQSRPVRVPATRAWTVHRLRKQAQALRQTLAREPTCTELASEMGMTETDVSHALALWQTPVSLDAPLTPDGALRLADRLADGDGSAPDDALQNEGVGDLLADAIAQLKPREAGIIRLYYGFDGREQMTLEEIGARLGITRERVRQIKDKALARLRRMPVVQVSREE